MRLATWNVNSVVARLPRLLDWVDQVGPDVVCLQETKVAAESFPYAEVRQRGYEVAAHGDGRWNRQPVNGVAATIVTEISAPLGAV